MNDKKTSNKDTVKVVREASEKLAQPVAPLAVGAQLKLVADTHAKVTGKKNWLSKHSTDLTLALGLIWSIGKIIYFYYPDQPWTILIRIIDAFLPLILVTTAGIFRLYPHIDMFFKKKK